LRDVTMLWRLSVGDFGHVMPSWPGIGGQKFGRFQPVPSQNQGCYRRGGHNI
jgi:hypothetical protein